MLGQELFAVPGFPVSLIYLSGLGVVDDLCSQLCNLGHPVLRRLDPGCQRIIMRRGRGRLFFQDRIVHQVMLGQVHHGLGHLLQVKRLGPVGVPHALPCLELCLNIHQQVDLGGCRDSGNRLFARRVLFLPGQNCCHILLGVAFAQAAHAGRPFPARGTKRDVLPSLTNRAA